jgi:TctA family transporter
MIGTAAIGGAMMATVGRNRRRILGLLPMIASAAIFLLYEHMSLPMQLCDKFTPLMVGLLAVNMILAYLTSGKTAEERSGDSD